MSFKTERISIAGMQTVIVLLNNFKTVIKVQKHHSPSEHDSRQEGWHIVMENPPAFDPETIWKIEGLQTGYQQENNIS